MDIEKMPQLKEFVSEDKKLSCKRSVEEYIEWIDSSTKPMNKYMEYIDNASEKK